MACIRGRGVAFGVRQALALFFMIFDMLAAFFIRSACCREWFSFWTCSSRRARPGPLVALSLRIRAFFFSWRDLTFPAP